MNMLTKILLTAVAGLAFMVGSANAAMIVYDFTGGTAGATTNDFSGDGVTANNISITNGGSNGWQIGSTQIDESDTISMKLGGTANAAFSITLGIGSTAIDLTGLSFAFDYESNNGSGSNSYAKWDLAISTNPVSSATGSPLTGSVGPYTPGNKVITSTENVTLNGLTGLTNTSVTFTFSSDNGTTTSYTSGNANDRRYIFDDITFTGEVATIPDPGSLAFGLFGMGGLCLRRRRRA